MAVTNMKDRGLLPDGFGLSWGKQELALLHAMTKGWTLLVVYSPGLDPADRRLHNPATGESSIVPSWVIGNLVPMGLIADTLPLKDWWETEYQLTPLGREVVKTYGGPRPPGVRKSTRTTRAI